MKIRIDKILLIAVLATLLFGETMAQDLRGASTIDSQHPFMPSDGIYVDTFPDTFS